jgi:hypothetical protein
MGFTERVFSVMAGLDPATHAVPPHWSFELGIGASVE